MTKSRKALPCCYTAHWHASCRCSGCTAKRKQLVSGLIPSSKSVTMPPGRLSNVSSFVDEKEHEGTIQDPAQDLKPSTDPVHTQTEAAVLPQVQQTGHPTDIEKGCAQAEPTNDAPPPAAFDPRQNPDGGLQAWLCVLGAFFTLFCSFGWINTIAVFQNYYQSHQLAEYSPSTVAWIPSLETFMNFFLGPFVGAIFDRYGHRWLLIIGTFLHVFGLMMTSISTEYYQFILAQGICSPIGVCMIFFPAMASITTWFFKKRAFAFGIVAAGSSLGGVVRCPRPEAVVLVLRHSLTFFPPLSRSSQLWFNV